MKPLNERNKNEQEHRDITMLPEGLFPDLLNQEFNDERTFENDDEQFDPIKTLSVHGLKRLPNHFSKVTVAISVNDIITINDMIDTLSGEKPDIWRDESKNWRI
jgi:hypothetical protein